MVMLVISLGQFETVQKLQGSQAVYPSAAALDAFETVQKLQGSQACRRACSAWFRFETVQKLQGSQASNITLKLSPNHYMLVMLYSL